MLTALFRTMTELADSKKAAYSFVATLVMAVLIVYFKVDRETAAFIVTPLVAGTVAQAHVDAAAEKAKSAPKIEAIAGSVSTTLVSDGPVATSLPGPGES